MDLNYSVDLLSSPSRLELYQENRLAHLNGVARSDTYLALGLPSICHLDTRLGFGLRLESS